MALLVRIGLPQVHLELLYRYLKAPVFVLANEAFYKLKNIHVEVRLGDFSDFIDFFEFNFLPQFDFFL